MRISLKISALIFCLAGVFYSNARGQEVCLTKEESANVIARFDTLPPPANAKELGQELVKMRETREQLEAKLLNNLKDPQAILRERDQLGKQQLLRLCQMTKEHGLLTRKMLQAEKEQLDPFQPDPFEAEFFIISNNRAADLQLQLLEVLAAAANKNLVPKNYLAPIVDNIRVVKGLPQIFGTQAKVRNNILYIYPLLNENKLAEWRKSYNLEPMAAFIRELEDRYVMPVLKMSRPAISAGAKQKSANDETAILGVNNDEDEVLEINTKLVNINVQILNQDLTNADALTLKQDDFAVYENGKEQKIGFFSNTEQPFDLILLLDFSGSTASKKDLIRKAAQRFIELARPNDRIAIVAFTNEMRIVSDLSSDRAALTASIKDLKMNGGSRIWDALKYTYKNIIEKQSQGRRSAIVFMTDGLDGSLNTTYADLMEIVRQGETTIFPVYLDPSYYQLPKKAQMAEKSMSMLAQESGGKIYPVQKLKDLTGIYEQVVKDLSRVYSISYEPSDEKRDGAWRELEVKIKNRPNLVVRSAKTG